MVSRRTGETRRVWSRLPGDHELDAVAPDALIAVDLAVQDVKHAVSVGGNVGLVGHQNYGISLLVQIIKQRHYVSGGLRVQIPGRLVRQDYGRIVDQSAG